MGRDLTLVYLMTGLLEMPTVAPEWETVAWLNSREPLSLFRLRGRVVLLHAFQMLCPGCVAHGLPQAMRAAHLFSGEALTVVGLHTVFEHHEAMKIESLRAFLHEYRIHFPIGIDAPGENGDLIPRTMKSYAMQGTPTTILIDSQGNWRRQVFGAYDDLLLGAEIGTLLSESRAWATKQPSLDIPDPGCADTGCAV